MAWAPPRPPAARKPRNITRPPKIETLFVVVPGVGTLEPEKWRDDTGESWLEAIPTTTAPGVATFVFPHGLDASVNGLWQSLIDCGPLFASDLVWLIEHEKINHCPIVIIAHSLGGMVVKEALRFMYQQSAGHRQLLRSLAAVILLGTPHSTEKEHWKHFANVLYTGSSTQKKRTMSSEDVVMLAESSLRFEHAHVSVPILSFYETSKTKIRKPMSFSQSMKLVDKPFVITRAKDEVVIGLDTDHRSLCNIDVRDKGFADLCNELTTALEDARLNIVNGSPTYRAPTVLDSSTVAGEDEFSLSEMTLQDSTSPQQMTSSGSASRTDPLSMYVASGSALELNRGTETEPEQMGEATKFPIFMMPVARNKDFVGRTEHIAQIETVFFNSSPSVAESFTSAADVPKTFAICGPGGVGKTQLAAEFVHRFRDRYEAIFWIHADKAAKIAEGFSKIAFALGLVDEDSPDARDPVVIRELVRGWLVNPSLTPSANDDSITTAVSWLLIFDNIDEPDELEDYWPLDGSGCVLFASRDPYTKDSNYLAKNGIDLGPMTDTEAAQLLSKLTKNKDDGTGVAQMLGGFPLAMVQTAGYIVRRALSYDEFMRQYKEQESHQEIFEHKGHTKARNAIYKHNIASVWALESLKHGAVLLNTLAFLDPDGVHERILTQNSQQVVLKDYPRTATTYFKARQELIQCSLVAKDKLDQRIVVHRLIQDTARTKMSTEQYRDTFATALTLMSSVWPYEAFGWRHEVARWKVCEELFPHILRLRDHAKYLEPSMGEHSDDLTYIKLMNDAGWYHHEGGDSANAGLFFSQAQEAAEKLKITCANSKPQLLIDLDDTLAEIHHNLGCVGTETNDPKSTLKHFQAFKDLVMSKSDRADQPGTPNLKLAIAWNELGNAWMLNKDWSQGEQCFLESIKLTKATPQSDPTDMSFPMVNLGLAHWFQGRPSEAVVVLEEGLRDREDKFGKDDTVSFITGRFFHALGNVKSALNLHEESLEYHQRGLKQYLATIGRNHHRTGDMHIKVGEHHLRLGNHPEARHHIDEAIRIFRDRTVLRPEYCRALLKKSIVLEQTGEAGAAKEAQQSCATIFQELLPNIKNTGEEITENDVDEMIAFWSR